MKDISPLEANGPVLVWPDLILCLWILSTGLTGCAPESSEKTFRLNVEEGLATETLKEAARQSEVEFIFSSELVESLRTPAIKGKFTPTDAFNLMLADSPLVIVRHQQSGVYSIQKSPDP